MAKKATSTKREMSAEHREALAVGRAPGKAIREYLAALQTQGSSRTEDPVRLEERVSALQDSISSEADPLKRVELIQQRLNAEQRLAATTELPDLESLEAGFVEVVAEYSQRKGITYPAWRELGVPAATLKAAGIRRSRT